MTQIEGCLVVLTCMVWLASSPLQALSAGAESAVPDTRPTTQLFPIFNRANNSETFGYIDASGHVVVPLRLKDAMDFADGLGRACDNDGPFFLDATGAVVFRIPAWAAECFFFGDGFCAVNKGGRSEIDGVSGGVWGFLNRKGEVAIEPRFSADVDRPVRQFSEGRAAFAKGKQWGYIDTRGKVVIPPSFDEADFFHEGHAPVRRGKKWFLLSMDGELAGEPKFDQLSFFSSGVAAARIGDTSGFVGHQGEWVFTLPPAAHLVGYDSRFSDGLAAILLPMHGIAPRDESCSNCGLSVAGIAYGQKCPHCGHEITGPLRWGYVDSNGREAIEPRFNDARPFSDGLAAVQPVESGSWGFIDHRGKFAIEPRYTSVDPNGFRAGLARVELRHKGHGWDSYVNKRGEIVWQSQEPPDEDGR